MDNLAIIALFILFLSFAFGLLVAIFQSGLEWRLWEGFTNCSSSRELGRISLDNLADEMAKAQIVRCDEAPFRFFFMSPANYNVFASIGYMALSLHILYQLKLLNK